MLLTLLAPGLAPTDAYAVPPDRPVAELLSELRTRYQAAGAATQAYNAAQERLRAQRGKVAQLNKELHKARSDLTGRRVDAGRLARAQYRDRTAGLTPYLRLALTREPQEALERRHHLARAANQQALTISRLRGGEQRLTTSTERARKALATQRTLTTERKSRRDTVQKRLDSVAELLGSFNARERTEVAELERSEVRDEQRKFLATGMLSGQRRTPSAEGREALAYAVRQIGKPYRWGGAGPSAFDCSGLTSKAWARAGRPMARTSQEQWRQLPRVRIAELRPGDLVVYFPEATHIGLYLGDGQVVHAPRPGSRVKVSPLAANPVLGAVRPDQDAQPLARYSPPPLPDGATDGDDTGYGGSEAPSG